MRKIFLLYGVAMLAIASCKKQTIESAPFSPELKSKSSIAPQQRGLPTNYNYLVEVPGGYIGNWGGADLQFGQMQYHLGNWIEGERVVPASVYVSFPGVTSATVNELGVVTIIQQILNITDYGLLQGHQDMYRDARSAYIDSLNNGQTPKYTPVLGDFLASSYGGISTKSIVAQAIRTSRSSTTFALVDPGYKVLDRDPD